MKKKTAKIEKQTSRPKLDKRDVEALVKELARPERLAREAERLLRRLRDEPALMRIRFAPEALVAAAREAAPPPPPPEKPEKPDAAAPREEFAARIADRFVTEEVRSNAIQILESQANAGGKLEDILPYRVGIHLLEAEREKERPPSQNPFWISVATATALELPLTLYLRARPAADLAGEAREGRAAPAFQDFIAKDEGLRSLKKALPLLDLEAILIHAMIGFEEAHEIALPLAAALSGPIESAKAARRRQLLAGVGSAAPPEAEQAKVLMSAIEKDKDRAVPAYREDLLRRFAEASREVESPETAALGERRRRSLFAVLVSLETLPASRNVPLMAAYEQAAPRAFEEAEEWEKPLLHAIFGRPLDAAGYRAYARRLLESDKPRARALAEGALAAFPGDAELEAVAKEARG
jgi:hypothetical protein